MKLRPITSEQYTDLEEGYMLLLRASAIFRRGGTPKTYARIKLALTSAQGAIRHARRRADASGARLIVKLPPAIPHACTEPCPLTGKEQS